MLLTVLFVVFMCLALVGHVPQAQAHPYWGPGFLWLAVLVLYLMDHPHTF